METLFVKDAMRYNRWNKQLPNPLVPNEEVQVVEDQSKVAEGYIRINHGENYSIIAIFNRQHFVTKEEMENGVGKHSNIAAVEEMAVKYY